MSKKKKKTPSQPTTDPRTEKKAARQDKKRQRIRAHVNASRVTVHKKYTLDQMLHCDALMDQLHRDQDRRLTELTRYEELVRSVKSALHHGRERIIALRDDLPTLQAKRDALIKKVGGKVEIIETLAKVQALKRRAAEFAETEHIAEPEEEVSS